MAESVLKSRRVVTEKIISKGRHGPYAVARDDELGVITFSLKPPVWQESSYPEPGTMVDVSNVHMKKAGWRALSACFVRPDEQQQPEVRKKQ